ncbi:n-acetyl-gamma-glutamyl-phosphate reductase [hydrocarbon metagenome]|uniref:N-acetyl-gamma-glutamyl-phosphate reductase n=1 Tax=hydrocarbon metagenome TaxID=938273 RepID=A0A0W8E6D3_9ZZZZ
MFKAGIIGDGYTAAELIRILAGHDEVEVVSVLSTENVGRRIDDLFPHLTGFCSLECEESDVERLMGRCDVVFLALPHGLSVNIALRLLENGIKCVDLGADFRLKDPQLYREYYELEHGAPEMLNKAVYGLPEIYREKIRSSDLVANPGCFPTGAILPMVPLLAQGIIKRDGIVIDSKSGVSGAGRTVKPASHFCEVNEGIRAYGVGTHRHGPEIRQELSFAAGVQVDMIFTPHLVPMNRGILSTCYAQLADGIDAGAVRQVLEDSYQEECFVRVLPDGTMPHTKWVYGSNFLDIGIYTDAGSGRVILVSAMDNLTKGASGQAVQNMNLMLGINERKALMFAGVHP